MIERCMIIFIEKALIIFDISAFRIQNNAAELLCIRLKLTAMLYNTLIIPVLVYVIESRKSSYTQI